MLTQRLRERALLLSMLDSALLWIAFMSACWIRLLAPELIRGVASPIEFTAHVWAIGVAIPLHLVLASASGLYDRRAAVGPLRLMATIVRVFALLGTALGLAIFLFQAKSFSRAVFALFLAIGFALIGGARLLLKRMAARGDQRPADLHNILIVGLGDEAREVREKIVSNASYGLSLVGHLAGPGQQAAETGPLPVMGELEDLRRIVAERVIDDVVIALPFSSLLACERQIAWCEEVGVTVHLKVDFVRTLLSRTYPSELDGTPMLTLASTPRDPVSLLVKRGVDIVISAAGLALLAPVLVACAAGVAMTSAGPVLFRQRRVGLNGRSFTLYKFRSMRADAEDRKKDLTSFNEMSGPVFKMRNDPRVTPVGRWLRKFSLDELPQLINVLKGDLSLVGPRPPTPDEVSRYERWQRRRLSVKPGVTCLWQISGRSQVDFEEWMRLDLRYIDNWSLRLDFEILLRTIPAVIFARGSH